MTIHDSVPHLIVDAARIAAPVFQAEGWTYWHSDNTNIVPREGEIADKAYGLLHEQGDVAESGRILIRQAAVETGGHRLTVYLNLGTYIIPQGVQ